MTKRIAVGAVKAHLSEVLRDVESTGQRVVIERRGRPVAVLQPYAASAEEHEAHWADALDGIAAGIEDFARINRETVASRRRARPRPVNLGE